MQAISYGTRFFKREDFLSWIFAKKRQSTGGSDIETSKTDTSLRCYCYKQMLYIDTNDQTPLKANELYDIRCASSFILLQQFFYRFTSHLIETGDLYYRDSSRREAIPFENFVINFPAKKLLLTYNKRSPTDIDSLSAGLFYTNPMQLIIAR